MNFDDWIARLLGENFTILFGYGEYSTKLTGILPSGELFHYEVENNSAGLRVWSDDLDSAPRLIAVHGERNTWELELVDGSEPPHYEFVSVRDFTMANQLLHDMLQLRWGYNPQHVPMSQERIEEYRTAMLTDLAS